VVRALTSKNIFFLFFRLLSSFETIGVRMCQFFSKGQKVPRFIAYVSWSQLTYVMNPRKKLTDSNTFIWWLFKEQFFLPKWWKLVHGEFRHFFCKSWFFWVLVLKTGKLANFIIETLFVGIVSDLFVCCLFPAGHTLPAEFGPEPTEGSHKATRHRLPLPPPFGPRYNFSLRPARLSKGNA
jgi:hypothetical protein